MEIKRLIVGALLTNCYLVISKNELLVIDPGDEGERILAEIEKIKAKPIYIINTHYHPDHTMADKIIKEKTGAKILIHEEEKGFIKFNADRFLTDGEEVVIGDETLKVLHTPGHTKGGICLLGNGVALTGDTLFEDGYGRTDLPGGSQKDLEESLKKLSQLFKKGTKIYPGHGGIFTIQ